jgi:hypothetical protein
VRRRWRAAKVGERRPARVGERRVGCYILCILVLVFYTRSSRKCRIAFRGNEDPPRGGGPGCAGLEEGCVMERSTGCVYRGFPLAPCT